MPALTPSAPVLPLDPGRRVRLEETASGNLVGCVAVVDSVSADRLVVRLLDPAPEGSFAPGSNVVLVLAQGEGLQRAASTVEEAHGDHERVLDLRLLRALDDTQRRAHPRVPVHLEVRARPVRPNGRGEVESMVAADISEGGIRLVGNVQHSAGTVLELELPTGDGPLALRGMVVAVRAVEADRWTAHVAFTSTTAGAARRRLARYVQAQPGGESD